MSEAPALYALYRQVYDEAEPEMMRAFYDKNPDGYMEYQLILSAEYALQHTSTNDINHITDIAYSYYFRDDPSAPTKLDASSVEHKPYRDTWLNLRDLVVQMKG